MPPVRDAAIVAALTACMAAACAGSATPAPATTGPTATSTLPSPSDATAAQAAPDRVLVGNIGDEPTVDCQDRSTEPPDWRDPAPPETGFVKLETVAFRAGCVSASRLDEALSAAEPTLVRCFEDAHVRDAMLVVRAEWRPGAGGPTLARIELRPAPDAAPLPGSAAALRGCVQATLSAITDLGPEPALPATVDLLVHRGFPTEVETLGVD